MGQTLTYQTEFLSPEKLNHYWPLISDELDRVPHIWDRWFTKEYLYQTPLSGGFHVWATGPKDMIQLVVYSSIVNYPASRILHVNLAIGNHIEECIPSLNATLEKFANDSECDYCEILGRRGWKKLLPGFEETATVFTRKLERFKVQ